MNENQKMSDSEIRGIIEIAFSDHSLIDDFIDNFHYYDLTQQDVIDYYTDFMKTCGEDALS